MAAIQGIAGETARLRTAVCDQKEKSGWRRLRGLAGSAYEPLRQGLTRGQRANTDTYADKQKSELNMPRR